LISIFHILKQGSRIYLYFNEHNIRQFKENKPSPTIAVTQKARKIKAAGKRSYWIRCRGTRF
jgi:hypothetical protein